MDRRTFCKLFAATAATASASKVLASIPEAKPKIQLLDKKIVCNDDAITLSHFMSYSLYLDNNMRGLAYGRQCVILEASVYADTDTINQLLTGDVLVKANFPPGQVPDNIANVGGKRIELNHTVFKIQKCKLHCSNPQDFMVVNITGIGIYHV